jgi:hypothetical protein
LLLKKYTRQKENESHNAFLDEESKWGLVFQIMAHCGALGDSELHHCRVIYAVV